MNHLVRDVLYSLRLHRKRPAIAIAAVVTIALGVGASVSVFSVLRATLLPQLPYPDAERLVRLSSGGPTGPAGNPRPLQTSVLGPLLRESPVFDSLAACGFTYASVRGSADAEVALLAHVTAGFFRVFGVAPEIGRALTPGDFASDGSPVVLSHELWTSQFGGRADVAGRSIRVGGEPRIIVGVMPKAFNPRCASERDIGVVWSPESGLGDAPATTPGIGPRGVAVFARLRPGVNLDAARNAVSVFSEREAPTDPTTAGVRIDVFQEVEAIGARPALLLLQATAVLLLVIACANVTNLLLAHTAGRWGEFALRLSLGATRMHIRRLALTDAALLGTVGSVCGVLLSVWTAPAIVNTAGRLLPPGADGRIQMQEWLVGILLAWAVALVVGTAPALVAAKRAVAASRSAIRPVERMVAPPILASGLVAAQTSAAVVVLICAGLLVRSFINVVTIPLGFDPTNLMAVDVPAPPQFEAEEEYRDFHNRIQDAVRANLVGVPIAIASAMPGSPSSTASWLLPSEGGDPEGPYQASLRVVSSQYFEVLRIPIARGSGFDARSDEPVAVVSEEFARKFGTGRDLLGLQIRHGSSRPFRIVGIAQNVRSTRFRREALEVVYVPFGQIVTSRLSVAVRSLPAGQHRVAEVLRTIIRRADPDLPMPEVRSLAADVGRPRGARYFYFVMASTIGLMCGASALAGVLGLAVHMSSGRDRELGVRVALGATHRQLTLLLSRGPLVAAAAGLAGGTVVAWWITKLIDSTGAFAGQLYHVQPHDFVTFGGVGLGLLVSMSIVTVITARRAATTDPSALLKEDA